MTGRSLLALMGLACFLSACSGRSSDGSLTRDEAVRALKVKEDEIKFVWRGHTYEDRGGFYAQIGKLGKGCTPEVPGMTEGPDATDDREAVILSRLGYIQISKSGKFEQVSPTTKGQEFLSANSEQPYAEKRDKAGCDYSQVTFPYVHKHVKAVTGISRNGNLADVEYTWTLELNQLGKQLVEDPTVFQGMSTDWRDALIGLLSVTECADTAKFKLYDDGWRLE